MGGATFVPNLRSFLKNTDSGMLPPLPALPLPWYLHGDYPALLELFSDAGKLPPTYDAWLERVHRIEWKLNDAGFGVAKIRIQPLSFAAWCRAQNIAFDKAARLAFVNAVWLGLHASSTGGPENE